MHKTPSGPFKAGTALNLDHESMRRARRAEEPLLGLCTALKERLLVCNLRPGELEEVDRRGAAVPQWLRPAEWDAKD